MMQRLLIGGYVSRGLWGYPEGVVENFYFDANLVIYSDSKVFTTPLILKGNNLRGEMGDAL